MIDSFNCPNCGSELPGTLETVKRCYFCFSKTEILAETTQPADVIQITPEKTIYPTCEGVYEEARHILNTYHKQITWRGLAAKLGVGRDRVNSYAAQFSHVANGGVSRPAVLVLLGLEPETAPAPICTNPTCDGYGQPHTYNCQTQAVIEKTAESKRVYNRKRTYPDYAKMRTNNIAQARRQFEKHYPEYEITRKER